MLTEPEPTSDERERRDRTKKARTTRPPATQIQALSTPSSAAARDTSPRSRRPRRSEAARIALPEDLGGGDAVGLRLGEVGLELRGHLVGHRIRHTQPFPFVPALLDERRHHGTSNSIVARTESTSPRTSCHARTPSARARRAARRGAVVLARRAAVARRAVRRDEAVALEPAEQRIDRPLADGGETPLAQPPRHLVAVGGLVDDDGEEAEIEDSAKHLAAPALTCHAPHGSGLCLAAQGRRRYGFATSRASSTNASAAGER